MVARFAIMVTLSGTLGLLFVAVCSPNLLGVVRGSDPQLLRRQSSWNWPESANVRTQVESLIDARLTGDQVADAREQALQIQSLRGLSLLERVLAIAALCDPSIKQFNDSIAGEWSAEKQQALEAQLSSLLANGAIPSWLKNDLQLAYSRALVHHELYDEALQRLQPIALESISDPATWLFCISVCQHHLLMRAPCLETLDRLLERETELPTRYAVTARLMQSDIKPLKEDSLDEIARMMNDVERRLSLGRTGKQVRDQENAIVNKLEKMIDNMEQQLQQQQQQQKQKNQGAQKQPAGKPLEESGTPGANAKGEVDQKDVGNGSGWGNLPPAQRQEALQNITKDLPSHYREVIEAYFKRLANPSNP